ncbi:A/G-specific adenine glycosylase [bacterium]|nr:A/G-specific adenine glycosylase [bacterium]
MSRKTGPNLPQLRAFTREVVSFYRTQGRHDLPWRRTRDPYHILVSEIMLQQTQVERVLPFYLRFLEKFPTIEVLASVHLSDVLKLWQGLGYNRRAKMLYEASKEVIERFDGAMPRSREELESLPGIGHYTAGAVRAFAFNEPDVFIETNIRTVLIHHFFPHKNSVDDADLLPILQKLVTPLNLCKSDLHNKNTENKKSKQHGSAQDAIDVRTWYAALMDYGSHLKKIHPNPSRKSKHHTKQSKFEGSLRQMRGEIVRALSNGTKLGYLKRDMRFEKAVEGLEKDGMIQKKRETWILV